MTLIGVDPGTGDKTMIALYRDGKFLALIDPDTLSMTARLRLWWAGYQVRLDDAGDMRPHHGRARITRTDKSDDHDR